MTDDAQAIIDVLGLRPHPEGGHFVETWRAPDADGHRAVGSAIVYLLRSGERSAWHRVDAAEIWHHYAGAPLELRIAATDEAEPERHVLGPGVLRGERPQVVVPVFAWQSAVSLGGWTLVGCTVSPAFRFEGFELAPEGWEPGRGAPPGEDRP